MSYILNLFDGKNLDFLTKKNNTNIIQRIDTNYLRLGWYRGDGGDGITQIATIDADEILTGLKFETSNAYDSATYYNQTKFNDRVKPVLESGRHCNFFLEFRGVLSNGTGPAQLPQVVNGSYDAIINSFYDHVFAYNESKRILDPNYKPKEVRLVIFHEINNTQDYEWGFNYNRSVPSDWNSALVNPANGSNTKAEYLSAVQRIRNIHNARVGNDQFKKNQVKITINFNYNFSVLEELSTFLPHRNHYDYMSLNTYDRYQASAGPAFFHVNLDFLVRKGLNRLYEQMVSLTDAPILICECGSSSNTSKYARADWFIQAVKDIRLYMPNIIEITYFQNNTADWLLTANDKLRISTELDTIMEYRPQQEVPIIFKPNIITKNLTLLASWSVAGANAGVLSMLTSTTPVNPISDKSGKNSQILRLSMTTVGTNLLANYAYFTELGSVLELNVPHTLTFQAWSDVDNVNLGVGVIDDVDASNNLVFRGNGFIKLGRKVEILSIGIVTGLMGTKMRIVFGIGNNPYKAGNIYINAESVKFEKGENASPNVPNPLSAQSVEVLG